MAESTQYASFMIRLWRETGPGPPQATGDWQGEVEHIQSGRQWRFDSLDELLGWLRRQMQDPHPLGGPGIKD